MLAIIANQNGLIYHGAGHSSLQKTRPTYAFVPAEFFTEGGFERRRYLESPENGWTFQLFVRLRKGEPYRACGPVVRESAEGDRPISIVWRLSVHLPVRFFQEFSVLRGQ